MNHKASIEVFLDPKLKKWIISVFAHFKSFAGFRRFINDDTSMTHDKKRVIFELKYLKLLTQYQQTYKT